MKKCNLIEKTFLNYEQSLKYFPFDEQTCVLKFGSWTYDGFKVGVGWKQQNDIKSYKKCILSRLKIIYTLMLSSLS